MEVSEATTTNLDPGLEAGVDGDPLLLECELTEPSLEFSHADVGAPLRFASAVRATLTPPGG
ncbi:MAG: hypothetical protein GEV09_13405 [Pseudonocardiaceae bacterium]|nr:hypothetical protein [Pseudonocardiaceae bacterium]